MQGDRVVAAGRIAASIGLRTLGSVVAPSAGRMSATALRADVRIVDADAATTERLCDHLDAVLGHGEALYTLSFEVTVRVADGDKMRALLKQNRLLGQTVTEARGLELALMLRLMRAVELARELGHRRSDLAFVLKSFAAGVAPALEVATSIDAMPAEDADAPLAWLRRRGLLADRVAGLADLATVTFDERMRIGGVVRLDVILDAAAAALDALEATTHRHGDQTGADLR